MIYRTKVGSHIVHGRTSACTEPEVKRSNPKPRVMVLTFAMVMGQDAEQGECGCRNDCTFSNLLCIFVNVATGAIENYICPAWVCMSIRLHIVLVILKMVFLSCRVK